MAHQRCGEVDYDRIGIQDSSVALSMTKSINAFVIVIATVSAGIVGVTLLLVGIGIMNIMLVSVKLPLFIINNWLARRQEHGNDAL